MKLDLEVLADVCMRNDIARLRVFGSFARGDATDRSDIDLIADFGSRKSLLDLVRIEREFSECLGHTVDLFTEAGLSPYLRDRILGDAKVVCNEPKHVHVQRGGATCKFWLEPVSLARSHGFAPHELNRISKLIRASG